jgi:hypothetical protein
MGWVPALSRGGWAQPRGCVAGGVGVHETGTTTTGIAIGSGRCVILRALQVIVLDRVRFWSDLRDAIWVTRGKARCHVHGLWV